MGPEHAVAAIMLAGLVLYMLGGGADFGGGVWDLLAFGPRRGGQRALIERTLGPVWEANHVWFVFVFVLLFAAFPPAFAAVTTALFGPLTAYAVGLVLRGSAFTFRHYEANASRRRQLGAVFSAASIGCPFLLGAMGAMLVRRGPLTSSFADPFVLSSGAFVLALTAALAATYLTLEADEEALREDFRGRAIVSLVVAGVAAYASLFFARSSAPALAGGWAAASASTFLGVLALFVVARRRYAAARVIVALLAVTVILGWGRAKGEVLAGSAFTIASSKAHAGTLRVLLVSCGAGAAVLFPSLWLLYGIFAPRRAARRRAAGRAPSARAARSG